MILIKLNGIYITGYKSLIEPRRVAALTKAADILIYLLICPKPLKHPYTH